MILASELSHAVRRYALPVEGPDDNFDALLERVRHARLVLLGEASHGTHEFYRARARITQRLIAEYGFAGVAAEADWPDAYRVNRYARGLGDDADAVQALGDFIRFPQWMWRNTDVVRFVQWLRSYNQSVSSEQQAGFYGMDLYSLNSSVNAVIRYLDRVDPDAAQRARQRYGCLEMFGGDAEAYGYATGLGGAEACEDQVVEQLLELQRHRADYLGGDGRMAQDEFFFAEQNARLARNAEAYYRAMFRGRNSSWNLRDSHMAETIGTLLEHLERTRPGARLVLWAHNSHLGDARATEMGWTGELNVGQLLRQQYGAEAVLVGFTTYTGTVAAASNWDAPVELKRVRPGIPGSHEELFHETGLDAFLLLMEGEASLAMREPRLERAIGVIYRPETERSSHYFLAKLPEQFDAVIHFDRTRAVQPLERAGEWDEEAPETFPSGV